jgi:hypothetical protein
VKLRQAEFAETQCEAAIRAMAVDSYIDARAAGWSHDDALERVYRPMVAS